MCWPRSHLGRLPGVGASQRQAGPQTQEGGCSAEHRVLQRAPEPDLSKGSQSKWPPAPWSSTLLGCTPVFKHTIKVLHIAEPLVRAVDLIRLDANEVIFSFSCILHSRRLMTYRNCLHCGWILRRSSEKQRKKRRSLFCLSDSKEERY